MARFARPSARRAHVLIAVPTRRILPCMGVIRFGEGLLSLLRENVGFGKVIQERMGLGPFRAAPIRRIRGGVFRRNGISADVTAAPLFPDRIDVHR